MTPLRLQMPHPRVSPVVLEWDPKAGRTVSTRDVHLAPAPPLQDQPGAAASDALRVERSWPLLAPSSDDGPELLLAPARTGLAARRLTEAGKGKVRRFVTKATTMEELADIEAALDAGRLSDALAARLGVSDADFETLPVESPESAGPTPVSPPQASVVPATQTDEEPEPPLGALALTPSGRLKVRSAIVQATDVDLLATLGKALTHGDVPALREMLGLLPEDLQGCDEDDDDAASTNASDDGDAEEYDPFATGPSTMEEDNSEQEQGDGQASAAPVVEDNVDETFRLGRGAEGKVLAQGDQLGPMAPTSRAPRPLQRGALGALQSAYEDSDSEEPKLPAPLASTSAALGPGMGAPLGIGPAAQQPPPHQPPSEQPCQLASKRRKVAKIGGAVAPDGAVPLSWPSEWAALVARTQQHPDFRAPTWSAHTRCTQQGPVVEEGATPQPHLDLVAISTALVYVGDASYGYDPRHLARVTVLDSTGEVLLDAVVRPRALLLDCRTHLTGLTRDSFEAEGALDWDTVSSRLLALLRPLTLVVGYRLSSDLEALRLWHGPLIDVSLLFGVEGRKQHQYHSLRNLARHLLGEEESAGPPVSADLLEESLMRARTSLRLAQYEAARHPVPTPAFAPLLSTGQELQVRHLPRHWGGKAALKAAALCPGTAQGNEVTWLLNESDPTDWRGETTLIFPDAATRDHAFEGLVGLTDVQVRWEDKKGAPPLGAFLTEQALIKAFSCFGVVVCARIPRRATTHEPQSFAFVSFLARDDALRVARQPSVDVQLTPTWTLSLKPRLAKYGQESDRRVAIRAGESVDESEWALDWVHVSRR